MSLLAEPTAPAARTSGIVTAIGRGAALLGRFPAPLTQLALRFALAVPFWRSGLTKWDGFLELSSSAELLFAYEFQLHLFGRTYPYPFPALAAWLAGVAEIVLPVLLVIGLGTRFAALGLLLMTLVIQLTVPEGWASFHLPWAAMALAVMTWGPGPLSLDQLLARGLRR